MPRRAGAFVCLRRPVPLAGVTRAVHKCAMSTLNALAHPPRGAAVIRWFSMFAALAVVSLGFAPALAQQYYDRGASYGAVTPDRMANVRETDAVKMRGEHPGAQFARVARFDLSWPNTGQDTGGFAVLLIDAQTHVAEELPIRRAYIRTADGREYELTPIGTQRFPIASDSFAYEMFGANQQSVFYWAPIDLLVAQGDLLIDYNVNRVGFRVSALPMPPPPYYRGEAHGTPNEQELRALLLQEYPGFTLQ